MAQTNAWRVSDMVAYDLLRSDAATLCGLLLLVIASERESAQDVAEELEAARRDAVGVDGFDRRAVDELAGRFRARIAVLGG